MCRHLTMKNEAISEARPLCSAASTLPINNALPGSRWCFAQISPALRTRLLFLLEKHVGLTSTRKIGPLSL